MLGGVHNRYVGGEAGIGSVQPASLTVITFFARLTGAQWGLLNHYYFCRPEELSADLRPPTSCPPDVTCQMPDVRRLRTAGVSALRASAYYGSGKTPEAEEFRRLDILLEGIQMGIRRERGILRM